ncbi:uncharacterized protein MCYG_04822 [Microsporum canis CBS 113480]|uniref:Uncharacterized protein n=1 Tax=Arthroderma otae (strain ATCC MYA-4605 / CBS 113480) TaxID=554155 RepID=C5FQ50_ARTOC|nr:uncharacterized protein MCYG_04822 [Microsporum canis CBS 113480]EEQ32003.1 predicted protein [Microsporum canis CBS 113480]
MSPSHDLWRCGLADTRDMTYLYNTEKERKQKLVYEEVAASRWAREDGREREEAFRFFDIKIQLLTPPRYIAIDETLMIMQEVHLIMLVLLWQESGYALSYMALRGTRFDPDGSSSSDIIAFKFMAGRQKDHIKPTVKTSHLYRLFIKESWEAGSLASSDHAHWRTWGSAYQHTTSTKGRNTYYISTLQKRRGDAVV